MSSTARKVNYIAPTIVETKAVALAEQHLRVAAYCRVSTDDEDQQNSYEQQIKVYTNMITDNPNWTMAGIFADEGLSGTSTKKRDEFNKLMALCKRGKVDLILVKSVSRFARNTLDSIAHVRQLKKMGVGVLFENINLNTLTMSSEMIFTVLSAFAQAESESISENVRWGKRHAVKQGRVPFQYSRILGYEKGEDGKPVIVPEQAATVKLVYAKFLSGCSISQIKADLEADGTPAASGKPVWSHGSIHYMLRNERYIGDALLQKTYIVDCISKEVRKNRGEVAQVYVENNHEAIIPKEMFYRVQEELLRRNTKRRVSEKALTEKGKYSGKYALSELMVCDECGARYRRVTWARGGRKKVVWRCISRLESGSKHCKHSPTLVESRLHDALHRAMNQLLVSREDVIHAMDDFAHTITDSGAATAFDRASALAEIARLEQTAQDILALAKGSDDSARYFEGTLDRIYTDRAALLDTIAEDDNRRAEAGARSSRLESLLLSIREAPACLDAYDDGFVREVIESVRVVDASALVVVFKGGVEVECVL